MPLYETGQNSYPEPPPERWRAMYLEAAAQRDAAQEQLALCDECLDSRNRNLADAAEIARLRSELEEARRDAARYRWLRDPANANRDEWNSFGPYSAPSEIDDAIDAAIAAQGAKE